MMIRSVTALASTLALFAACNVNQDLGDLAPGEDAGPGDDRTASSGGASSGGASSGGSSTSSSSSSGGSSSGGSSSGGADVPCPAVAGYEAGPFVSFAVSASTFAGSYVISSSTVESTLYGVAGIFDVDGPPDLDGHFAALVSHQGYAIGGNIDNGFQPERDVWILTDRTDAQLQVGTTYPVQFSLMNGALGGGQPDDSLDDQGRLYRYPGTGAGSCSLIVDGYRAGTEAQHACLQARFSCAGLVGAETGESFEVTGGKLSIGE